MASRTAKPKQKNDVVLAAVTKGFADVAKRLTSHDTRFDGVENHLMRVEGRMAKIEDRLTDHAQRFDRIEHTLETLVKSVDHLVKIYTDLTQELVVLRQHLRDVESRVEFLERKLKAA